MRRHELTDEEWATLEPLLPPSRPATGRPNKNHRTILNGILWILRTGAPWRDLPERFGPWRTVYSRFRRWQQAGVWERALAALQSAADAAGLLDWSLHFVDATGVRAHQHAAGARRSEQALGRSRGGFGTKVHVRAERSGKPLVFALTGGERHEQLALPALLEHGAV